MQTTKMTFHNHSNNARFIIYVHHIDGIVTGVYMGGDYMEVTGKLSSSDKEQIAVKTGLRW